MFFNIAIKGKNSIWLYILGLVILFLLTNITASLVFIFAIGFRNITLGKSVFFKLGYNLENLPFSSNISLFLVLMPFVIGVVILLLIVKFLHKKDIFSVFTTRYRFDKSRFIKIFFIWFLFSSVLFLIDYYYYPEEYTYQFNLLPFLGLLLFTLQLMPFQAAFEELLFRGYLMQGIGIATNSRFLALLITSILFGLIHSFNPEVEALGFWKVMPFYIGFGLFLGLVAIFDNGLELPIGIHTAHNIFIALIDSSEQSALDTHSLFTRKELSLEPIDYLYFFLLLIVTFFIIKWMYKWKNLKSIFLPIIVK